MWRRGVGLSSLQFIQSHGDGLSAYALAKSFQESPFSLWNYHLGYPNGLSIVGQPSLSWVHIITLWVFAQIFQNPISATNFLYFLGFGLSVGSAWWVFRYYKIHSALAFMFALSFSFIPEHWQRQSHLYLSLYWTIPISCLFIIEVNSKRSNFLNKPNLRKFSKIFIFTGWAIFFFLLTEQGVYYAVFTFLIALVIYIVDLVYTRKWDSLKQRAGILLTIFAGLLGIALGIETKLAQMSGTNLAVFIRSPFESLLYGGLLPNLIYPWPGSNLYRSSSSAAQVPNLLNRLNPNGNENQIWQGLIPGLCIAVLLIFMAFALLKSKQSLENKNASHSLDVVPAAVFLSILFYVSGGLGFILSFINSQIRSWNRLSFFISFLSILWCASKLQSLMVEPKAAKRINPLISGSVIAAVGLAILSLDSLPSSLHLDMTNYRQQTIELQRWSNGLEAKTGGHCPVLQLPMVDYPEVPPAIQMADYEEFLPYLTTKTMSFTYGSMKQTELSAWHEKLPAEINANYMNLIAGNGFCALEWDALGVTKEETAALKKQATALYLPILSSSSGRWSGVILNELAGKLDPETKLKLKSELIDSIHVSVISGLDSVEQDAQGAFRWATRNDVLAKVENPTTRAVTKDIEFVLESSPSGNPRTFRIYSGKWKRIITLGANESRRIRVSLSVKPKDSNMIRIVCDGSADHVATDPRAFYFRVREISGIVQENRLF